MDGEQMSYPSFEQFYFLTGGKLHEVAEVQKQYEIDPHSIVNFKGRMFCPECRQAELRFTHQTHARTAFLSKIPSSQHREGCPYIHNYATKKELSVYISTLSKTQIQDRLEATLNRLIPNQHTNHTTSPRGIQQHPLIFKKQEENKHSTVKRLIPHKSLYSWFNREIEGEIFIFYGKVRLHVESFTPKKSSNNSTLYRLIVQTKRHEVWRYRTKIFRHTIKDEIDENRIYDLAVFGHIEFFDNKPQLKTETLTSIYFRESTPD